MSDTDDLKVTFLDGVLRLTIARPRSGNSLTAQMVQQLRSEILQAPSRPGIRVIAMDALGSHFCTGVDLKQANTRSDGRPRVGNHQRAIEGGVNDLIKTLADVPLPVVTAVRGWAMGVGLSMVLLSDHVVASSTSKLVAPFTARGFSPDSGTTYLLPRMVGLHRARQMLLLGEPVCAEQAVNWGLVTELSSDDGLEQAFEATVARYAAAATVSVGLAKMLIRTNLDADLSQALRAEAFAEEVSLRSADFKEGLAAFLEKREPQYSGE